MSVITPDDLSALVCAQDDIQHVLSFTADKIGTRHISGKDVTVGYVRHVIEACFSGEGTEPTVRAIKNAFQKTVPTRNNLDRLSLASPPVVVSKGRLDEFRWSKDQWNQRSDHDQIAINRRDGPIIVLVAVCIKLTGPTRTIAFQRAATLCEKGLEGTSLVGLVLDELRKRMAQVLVCDVNPRQLDSPSVFERAVQGMSIDSIAVEQCRVLVKGCTNFTRTEAIDRPLVLQEVVHGLVIASLRLSTGVEYWVGFGDAFLIERMVTKPIKLQPILVSYQVTTTSRMVALGSYEVSNKSTFHVKGSAKRTQAEITDVVDQRLHRLELLSGLDPELLTYLTLFRHPRGAKPADGDLPLPIFHLQHLTNCVILDAQPHLVWTKNEQYNLALLVQRCRDSSVRYSFSDDEILDYLKVFESLRVRTGPWEEGVDGPALCLARDVVAHFVDCPSHVVYVIVVNESPACILPPTRTIDGVGSAKLAIHENFILKAVRGLYALYSGRMLPTQCMEDEQLTEFHLMIRTHISSSSAAPTPRVHIRFAEQANVELFKNILSSLVNKHPFCELGLNNWTDWYQLCDQTSVPLTALQVDAVREIGRQLNATFEGANLVYREVSRHLRRLVDELVAQDEADEKGESYVAQRAIQNHEIQRVAIGLHMHGITTLENQKNYLDRALFSSIAKKLPGRTESDVAHIVHNESEAVEDALGFIQQVFYEHGGAVFKSSLDSDDIAILERRGVFDKPRDGQET